MPPPKDKTPSELFRKLSERPRPSDVVDFPRKDAEGNPVGRIRIQVLTTMQMDEARAEAQRYLTKQHGCQASDMESEIVKGISGDAVATELLAMSLVSENPIPGTEANPTYAREFLNGTQMRQTLTADEIAALFKLYLQVQHDFGPTERAIEGDQDVNAWIRVLSEGGKAYPLSLLDSPDLVELTMLLAARACSLSRVLESHLSSLPASLAADLTKWGIGTGFFTKPPLSFTVPSSGDESPDDEPIAEPGEILSPEDAAEVARKLAGR